MDIREYSYVLTIVKCGSISEAARTLYITQPALSIYLHSLENRLGMKLFAKTKNGLVLTDVGRQYVEYAEKIVALDNELERKLQEIRNLDCGEVVLGVTKTRGSSVLSYLLPMFAEKYPGITVKIIEKTSHELEEMILSHQIDLAITNHSAKTPGIQHEMLTQHYVVVTIPKDNPVCHLATAHPDTPYPWIDIRALRQESFILLRKEQKMRQIADNLFQNAGFQPYIRWEISNATTAYKLSSQGLGLSFITSSYCMQHEDSRLCWFSVGEPPIVYNITAAYAADFQLSHAASAMLKTIKELFMSEDSL